MATTRARDLALENELIQDSLRLFAEEVMPRFAGERKRGVLGPGS
jgi:hypothetical protein